MQYIENEIKTMLVNSDDGTRNYEIIREISGDGIQGKKEAVLVTICPSDSALGELKLDSTSCHIINHLNELGIKRLSILNLFAKITSSRMSCKGLEIDTDNMEYIETKMKNKQLQDTLFIIGWGSAMKTSDAVNLSKQKVLAMYKKYYPKNKLYQLNPSNIDSRQITAPHPLYLGIYSSNSTWSLKEYILPKEIMEYEPKNKEKNDSNSNVKAKKQMKSSKNGGKLQCITK